MDAHELYGLPLDRFVAERTALAKELRKSGDREQAEAIASLRKPSLAAWAVNQLVRTQRRDITELFKAGDAARRAQAALLSGRGKGPALRQALDRERAAVEKLTRAARGLLSSEGHELSPAMVERVSDTLHAAALEEEAGAQVKDGCLDRELRHVGLGGAGPSDLPAPRSSPTKPGRESQPDRKSVPTATGEPRITLRRREADARRAAERAARELKAAQARRDAAAVALAEAESVLADAEQRAKDARGAHDRAGRELRSR
jgi:hypothetical protein